jgi:hypothetical protein
MASDDERLQLCDKTSPQSPIQEKRVDRLATVRTGLLAAFRCRSKRSRRRREGGIKVGRVTIKGTASQGDSNGRTGVTDSTVEGEMSEEALA